MKTNFAPWASGDRPNAVTMRSADGVVAVSLQRTCNGIFVQRALQRRGAARVVQTSKFTNASEFRRWCEADASRFDYPLLSARLVHHADELFSDCDATPDAG